MASSTQYSCLVDSEYLCLRIYLFSIQHISDLLCLHSFAVACISILFPFMAEKYSNICIHHNLFTHLSVYFRDCCEQQYQKHLCTNFFNEFWCIPKNRIADQMIILCLIFWKLEHQALFDSDCHFTFPAAMYEGSFISTSSPNLFSIVFLKTKIQPTGCEVVFLHDFISFP